MSGRTYANARVGIQNMNRVIEMARMHGVLTIKQVAHEFEYYEKSAKMYLQRLVGMGLMTERPMAKKNSIRYFDLVPGTQLIPVPELLAKPRPSVKKSRPGAANGRKKRLAPGEFWRCVHVVPAAQIGMQRDPLVAALFGAGRAAA
jgi:hypothetical protein